MTDAPLDTFRPSTLGWLKGTLAGWGTVLLFIAGIVLWLMNTANLGMYWVALSLLALGIFVWRWFENLASKFSITEERLIIRRGIIAKSVDEIELYRIKDVRINFSIINQIAGIGTISISSSDETTRDGDLVIRDVERAQARREELRRLVDTARQKRRVREIDMVHEDIP
ncbi:MAG TPA: PH domain-containing protein [Allosphingosinicella sp.]|nr:PH domain-containing protein [Allosphingosinicella sp.]